MADLAPHISQALLMAAGMFWQVGWSLALGFGISAILQAVVSKESMTAALGRDGVREIALATAAGAASSSCSYASAAVSRTLFKKGAALIPSLAFMFASTNLVAELGIIFYLLMGWQFMVGEWIGGVVLVVILSCLVRLTYPKKLVEEARHYPEARSGHEHGDMTAEGAAPCAQNCRAVKPGSTLPSACLPSRYSQSSAAIPCSTGIANIMRIKGKCTITKEPRTCNASPEL